MVSSRKPPSAPGMPPAGRRRRRPAPTIDLTATEVAARAAAPQAVPQATTQADDAPRQPRPETPSGNAAAAPAHVRGKPWARAVAFMETRLTLPYVVAGLIGGGVVCAILFAMWLTGAVPVRYAGAAAMRTRVTVLETQMRDLQNRPPPADTADALALAGMLQRIARLEQGIAQRPPSATDPALVARIDAVENALKALGVTLTALNRRTDEAAAAAADAGKRADAAAKALNGLQAAPPSAPGVERAAFEAMGQRVADLERTAKDLEERAGKPATAVDPTMRLASVLSALQVAAASGEPFATLLDTAKALGADAQRLAALEPFARSGIPDAAQLAGEMQALLPALIKSSNAAAPRDGTFLERLQTNASHLVRIRPVGAPQGDDAGAVIARIEIKAAAADLAGMLAELNKLPAAARAPAEPWIRKVQARRVALDASRELAGDALRALGSRTP